MKTLSIKQAVSIGVLLIYLGAMGLLLSNLAQSSQNADFVLPTKVITADSSQLRIANQSRQYWVQALYQVQVQAQQEGWTVELFQTAGNVSWQMGDTHGALLFWETIRNEVADLNLLRRISEAQLQIQDWTSAQATLEKLWLQNPDDDWVNYQLGLLKIVHNSQDVVTYFPRIPPTSPYFALASRLMEHYRNGDESLVIGIMLSQEGLWSYAELAFRTATYFAYPNPLAMAYLGFSRIQQSKEGRDWLDQAVLLEVDNPEIYYLQGLSYRIEGDFHGSLGAFLKSVSLSSENAGLYAELGNAYRLVGQIEDAEFWLDTAVTVSNESPEFSQLLETFYTEEAYRSPKQILTSLAESFRQKPDDPELLSAYGWALHATGDSLAGLAHIEEALSLAPDNPQILFDKAHVLVEMGHDAEARPLLERVAEMYAPVAIDAQELLRTLDEN